MVPCISLYNFIQRSRRIVHIRHHAANVDEVSIGGAAALRVYKGYAGAGLQEEIPFFGVGMQYIRFAREEPELYRLLFLTQEQGQESLAVSSMRHLQELVRPSLMGIYHITAEEADVYFRDMWLAAHSISTLIVTGSCPYSDREIEQILTGFSVGICKAIKEIPGFASGSYDRDAVFQALVDKKKGQ